MYLRGMLGQCLPLVCILYDCVEAVCISIDVCDECIFVVFGSAVLNTFFFLIKLV